MIKEQKANTGIFPNGPLKILYFDDNQQDLRIMQKYLSDQKAINLECVSILEQFNTQLRNNKYNCLIIDYSVPGMNIFYTVNKLFEYVPRRPIIIVSGLLDKKLSTSFQDFPFLRFPMG